MYRFRRQVDTNKSRPFPGKLIVVEGVDGSGKSTQVYLLKRWLELNNVQVWFTEWNSSRLVKRATKRGKKRQLLTPTTFSLIHCTDFAHRYEHEMVPLLKQGYVVLADRYMFTAFARDSVRGCDRSWLRNLYRFARLPDIIFYFDVAQDVAASRVLTGRAKIKYYEAGMDLGLAPGIRESFRIFQGRIAQEYERMVVEYGFTRIDASQPIELQQEEVRRVVAGQLDIADYKWPRDMVQPVGQYHALVR